ncbi:hypothetical protein V496_03786 [Pseudogymnoascus sp. VKM F-4515 (FW-2607)]|nr:hypothetical protein V496_03786 [Pseudogymnoascus sp. VKM F-4515 (FW-2607)]KFY82383.1 hypothetical protein V498_08602 [Pseudogymnoascus sp. VKM F-4517 (FW-2822)]
MSPLWREALLFPSGLSQFGSGMVAIGWYPAIAMARLGPPRQASRRLGEICKGTTGDNGSRLVAPESWGLRGWKDSGRGVLIRPAPARLKAMSEPCTAAAYSPSPVGAAEESNDSRSNSHIPYTLRYRQGVDDEDDNKEDDEEGDEDGEHG